MRSGRRERQRRGRMRRERAWQRHTPCKGRRWGLTRSIGGRQAARCRHDLRAWSAVPFNACLLQGRRSPGLHEAADHGHAPFGSLGGMRFHAHPSIDDIIVDTHVRQRRPFHPARRGVGRRRGGGRPRKLVVRHEQRRFDAAATHASCHEARPTRLASALLGACGACAGAGITHR